MGLGFSFSKLSFLNMYMYVIARNFKLIYINMTMYKFDYNIVYIEGLPLADLSQLGV